MNKIGKKVVTQQMIADAAGVHLSTVSLALRKAPRIPEATRAKIRQVAEKLGYEPNPLVSILMARVRRGDGGYRGTLGFLHTVSQDAPKLKTHQHRNFLLGARARANELGYNLDEFFLPVGERPVNRLLRILSTRSVHGLVIEHLPGLACPDRRLPFDCSPFAVASLGMPLASPPLHYVANDQYMRAVQAGRNLLALGYDRIGLVIDETFDQLMAHRCSAGFWALQQYTEGLITAPILRVGADGLKPLEAWLKEHRPTAVLGTHIRCLEEIRRLGYDVPGDMGWAHLAWLPEHAPAAGVYGNSEHTGASAVELVVSQLQRGETGPPARVINYLVSGSWMPGETLRKVGSPIDLDETFFGDHATA